MTTCPYCARPATATIVANPHRVCLEHAVEFWTGLLDYTRGRTCDEKEAALVRASAILGANPSPGDHVGFAMGLAS